MKLTNLVGGILLLLFLWLIYTPSFVVKAYGIDFSIGNPLHGLWTVGIPLVAVPYSFPLSYILVILAVACFVTAFREPSQPKMPPGF